jgi:biotin operon repressor
MSYATASTSHGINGTSTHSRSVPPGTASTAGQAAGGGGHPGQPDPRRYMQLAALVRQQIRDGTLAAGQHLPSITGLCEELACSRQTAGKAMQQLERAGLVFRVPGLGYFVAGTAAADGQETST